MQTVFSASTPTRLRVQAFGVYALALAAWIFVIGVPTDVFQLFFWLWLATIAWNIGAPPREHFGFVRDWWAPTAVLVVYLYSRGLSDELAPFAVHWTEPIRVDLWLGFGELPTQRLQSWLCASPCVRSASPRWYDIVLTTVYFSHFVTGLTVAVVLWLRDRPSWVSWMRRYVTINVGALVVYVLYPMAPPWLASQQGYVTGSLSRLTGRGWSTIGMGGFHTAIAHVGNPVAAMPSLHAGISMLIAVYGIQRLRTGWRWLLVAYPLAMGFALVYDGEHYVVDVLAGWLLAAAVAIGCGWWERQISVEPPNTATRRASRLR